MGSRVCHVCDSVTFDDSVASVTIRERPVVVLVKLALRRGQHAMRHDTPLKLPLPHEPPSSELHELLTVEEVAALLRVNKTLGLRTHAGAHRCCDRSLATHQDRKVRALRSQRRPHISRPQGPKSLSDRDRGVDGGAVRVHHHATRRRSGPQRKEVRCGPSQKISTWMVVEDRQASQGVGGPLAGGRASRGRSGWTRAALTAPRHRRRVANAPRRAGEAGRNAAWP